MRGGWDMMGGRRIVRGAHARAVTVAIVIRRNRRRIW